MPVASRSNLEVKKIRSLRNRKAREETGLFYAEGIRIVGEAATTGAAIETVILAPDLLTSKTANDVVEDLKRKGVDRLEVTGDVFKSFSTRARPQGLAAVVHQQWTDFAEANPASGLCWIALDEIQDPGNLGSIIRTADAIGAGGIILVGRTTDPFDPEAVRASMGSIFSLDLVRAGFADFLNWARANDASVVGASDKATADFQSVRYPWPLVLLAGSEREGLSPEEQAACDQMVRVPMVGRADSLNLSVATAVILYEIFNQNRKH